MCGAYYTTYYIATRSAGKNRLHIKNKNISIIDRFAFARDKSFCIVEIAGKVYIVGVTNHTMTLLDTIDAAAFAELTANNREPVAWQNTPVGQYGNKLTKRFVEFIMSRRAGAQDEEETTDDNDSAHGSKFAETMKAAQAAKTDESQDSEDDN